MNYKIIIIVLDFVGFCSLSLAYNKNKCDAPPSESGYCMADLARWVFKDKKCQRILYGGCGGTPNLFLFKYHCEVACDVPKLPNYPYGKHSCIKRGSC